MKSVHIIFATALFILALPACNSPKSEKKESHVDSNLLKATMLGYSNGKAIFQSKCNACHASPATRQKDQYLFDKIFERMPEPAEQYFIKYVQDSKLLKDGGDKYAIQLDLDWSPNNYEHAFKKILTPSELSDIATYIKVVVSEKNKK